MQYWYISFRKHAQDQWQHERCQMPTKIIGPSYIRGHKSHSLTRVYRRRPRQLGGVVA